VVKCKLYEASHYVIVFVLLFFHISQIQLSSSALLLKQSNSSHIYLNCSVPWGNIH